MRQLARYLVCMLVAMTVTPAMAGGDRAGTWCEPGGERVQDAALYRDLARQDVILLGERHDRMEHHRWQLSTIAQLRAHRNDLVIALEMLPRQAQPALDGWLDGELDEDAFLAASDWYTHWGYHPDLYLPILHFARLHGIPLRAVNLDRSLVQRIGAEGWEAVPTDERYDVGPAAAPADEYRERLQASFEGHAQRGMGGSAEAFVRAQLARDRAMAEGVVSALDAGDEPPLVVLLAGSGHMEYGHGVPEQLRDLGIDDVAVVLPRDSGAACASLEPDLARAAFLLSGDQRHELQVVRLGVVPEDGDHGVYLSHVAEDSVAAAAELRDGDVIVRAAGRELQSADQLRRLVHQQNPGTWMPLTRLRDGEETEVIARFPATQRD